MFGSLLSDVIKVVTLPIDAAESVLDVAVGGDGSKRSKQMNDNPMSDIRDAVAKAAEDLD